MNDKSNPYSGKEKTLQSNQCSEHGVYVREDDREWGRAGMDNIEEESYQSK